MHAFLCHVWAEEPLPVKAFGPSQAKLGVSVTFVTVLRAGVIMDPAHKLSILPHTGKKTNIFSE